MRKVERRLRDKIKDLELKLSQVEADREKFRQFMVSDLRRNIELCGKNQYLTASSWIERIAVRLQDVERWWWA